MNLAFRLAGAGSDGAPRLPGSLHVNRRLSQWLRMRREGFVEVFSGKVDSVVHIITGGALTPSGAHSVPVTIMVQSVTPIRLGVVKYILVPACSDTK